jgi:hypothetical protein
MEKESEDWKVLCQLVASESDAQKISGHLKRLLQALDARSHRMSGTAAPQKPPDLAESPH